MEKTYKFEFNSKGDCRIMEWIEDDEENRSLTRLITVYTYEDKVLIVVPADRLGEPIVMELFENYDGTDNVYVGMGEVVRTIHCVGGKNIGKYLFSQFNRFYGGAE